MTEQVKGVFLGHAGFLLEYQGLKILIDPWFSAEGAFYGSWHQWPNNRAVLDRHPEIFSPDVIWISHEHADHFDENFLSKINKGALVILPNFVSQHLSNRIRALGFKNIKRLSHLESYDITKEVSITILIESPAYTEHSSAHFKFRDIGVFHNSDSSFSVNDLQSFCNKMTTNVYIGQYSVTSPFPDVMNWLESDKNPHRANHLTWSIDRFCYGVKNLRATSAIPCAGPALALGFKSMKDLSEEVANDNGGFGDRVNLERIAKLLPNVDLCYMYPGQTFKITDIGIDYARKKIKTSQERLETLKIIYEEIGNRAKQRKSKNDVLLLKRMHEERFNESKKFCPLIFSTLNFIFSVYFTDQKKRLEVDFRDIDIKVELKDNTLDFEKLNSSAYQIEISSDLWGNFLSETDATTFDDINYSQLFRVTQNSGGYSSDFIVLLRAMHDVNLLIDVNNQFAKSKNETMEVVYCGNNYRLNRYCPHLGMDLLGHTPDAAGIITCKGHGWRFDVMTGKCLFGDTNKSIASS